MGDKRHVKGTQVRGVIGVPVGGGGQGCSVGVAFKKKLREGCRPSEDNSPLPVSRADLYWDPESYTPAS